MGRLTDADRKWMLSAEYGGTGGIPMEGGMIVEEPDIEIGQGVSSKAISRRMQTDMGGQTGPKSTREHEEEHRQNGHSNARDNNKRDNNRRGGAGGMAKKERHSNINGPPSMPPVPAFGLRKYQICDYGSDLKSGEIDYGFGA